MRWGASTGGSGHDRPGDGGRARIGSAGCLVTLLWLISLRLRDASIVDVFWGLGFVALNLVYVLLAPDGTPARKVTATVLVSLWGIRLAVHLFRRNWGRPEDYRYLTWRGQAGSAWWWRSYFKVFLLQGVLTWVIGFPLLAAPASPTPPVLIWMDGLSFGLWSIGFLFESVGDWQLAPFRSNPEHRGKLLTHGLWRTTRHPKTFGDAL